MLCGTTENMVGFKIVYKGPIEEDDLEDEDASRDTNVLSLKLKEEENAKEKATVVSEDTNNTTPGQILQFNTKKFYNSPVGRGTLHTNKSKKKKQKPSSENENFEDLEFFRVASDGGDLPEPIPTRLMVLGGAQREDILIPFSRPGRYQIVSEGLEDIQFFCTGPKDAVLAEVEVRSQKGTSNSDVDFHKITDHTMNDVDLLSRQKDDVMKKNRTAEVSRDPRFPITINTSSEITKKWISRSPNRSLIEDHEVKKLRTLTMSILANSSKIPFPDMLINGQMYSNNLTFSDIEGGIAEEWTVINTDRAMHPFHVHVVPFQVISVVSAYRNDHYAIQYLTDPAQFKNQWRDTVIVPPEGRVTLRIRFPSEVEYKGKCIFHCHFMAHEDTGMMSNIMVN